MISKEIIDIEINKINKLNLIEKTVFYPLSNHKESVMNFINLRKYSEKLELTKEDIIEIEKLFFIKLKYDSNDLIEVFLKMILGSCAMSKNFEIVYDNELVNIYKSLIFYNFISSFIEKNLQIWDFKANKLLMDNSTVLGKIFNIFLYEDNEGKIDKIYSLEEELSNDTKDLFLKYVYDTLGKMKIVISGKDFDSYSNAITNNLNSFLIENWSEYGLYLTKNKME